MNSFHFQEHNLQGALSELEREARAGGFYVYYVLQKANEGALGPTPGLANDTQGILRKSREIGCFKLHFVKL